ncbi:outer envelope pore protein 37, chloroplastic-like [Impatiens glandulifera]|uniref:outer envelope pore protein 37, chloroplastic-like n=1 Tax=Impatiens glandulifera TaxID=253017 RepID=UPI001FB05946|nr:outer envelope pore protein 37, chloroplastic-like [Impatiens glandulifera]
MAESVPTSAIIVAPPATTSSALLSNDASHPPSTVHGFVRRPILRVTSEFDSDSSIFFHKISCKFLRKLAKLKFAFKNNDKGDFSEPQLAFISKYLCLHYDHEEKNALVQTSCNVTPGLHFKAAHNVKEQEGEVAITADIAGPAYKLELSSTYPNVGMPKATFKFPAGEVTLKEDEVEDEEKINKVLSINGTANTHILNGICTAHYNDDYLNLRYSFKDKEMSFLSSLALPSNELAFAFKRQLSPSDKLSYWYNFNSNYWSLVYKNTASKDCKFKAGYDSEVRLGWASVWVGDESKKAKTVPLKMKVQFMLQVPQDDIKSSTLLFRVKKRWDI